MRGDVDTHVVAAGQERGHEHGGAGDFAQHVGGCWAEDVDERRADGDAEHFADTRSARSPIIVTPSSLAGAVCDQDGIHAAPPDSSTASR